MLFKVLFTILVVGAYAEEETAAKELKEVGKAAKSFGSYGYGPSGPSYGHHGGNYGPSGYHHGGHSQGGYGGYGHTNKFAQIALPYLDRNGCRFPGDVVCASAAPTDATMYGLCVLASEANNLWKKPTLTVQDQACPANTMVLSDWCNDNERLLRAAGLIKKKSDAPNYNWHLSKRVVAMHPCLLTA